MKWIVAAILVLVLGSFIAAEHVREAALSELGFAFGCGRHYASNYDPADDPTDMNSKCYPAYKAWEKSEQWPRTR